MIFNIITMFENIIILNVKNLPYKKMQGFLKNQKINPDNIALRVVVGEEYTHYTPLKNWQNYLPFSHKVVAIILYKINNIFLFVGHSVDNETIVYNPDYSKSLLSSKNTIIVEQKVESKPATKKRSYFKRSKITRLDILLDKITKMGIVALTDEEKKELEILSKNQN